MKFYLSLFGLFLTINCWTQLPLRVGAIDQNDLDRPGALLERSFQTPEGQLLVLFDYGLLTNRFLLFDDTTAATFHLARLDEFEYTIRAARGPFLLINDRPSFNRNQATQIDTRTGETRVVFISTGGFGFTAAVGDGYVYADADRNLWATDGTEEGTFLITAEATDITAQQLGDQLILGTSVGLFVTDGTPMGTEQLLTREMERTTNYVTFADQLYFLQNDGLYVTDGTVDGTENLLAGTTNQFSTNLTATASGIVFVSQTRDLGREIWTTDGTAAGTVPVTDLNPGAGDGVGITAGITSLNGHLLFRGGSDGADQQFFEATPTGLNQLLDLSTGIDRDNWRPFLLGTAQTDRGHYVTTNHLTDQQVLWRLQAGQSPRAIDTFGTNAILNSRSLMVEDALFFQGGADPNHLYRATGTTIETIDSLGAYNGRWLGANGHFYYTAKEPQPGDVPIERLRRVSATSGGYETLGSTVEQNEFTPYFVQDGEVFAFSLDSARAEVIAKATDQGLEVVTDLLPYTERSSFEIEAAAGPVLYVQYGVLNVIKPGASKAEPLGVVLSSDATRYPLGEHLLFDISREQIQLASPDGLQTFAVPEAFQIGRSGYAWFNGAIYFLVHNSNRNRTIFHLVRFSPDNPEDMQAIYSFTDDERGLPGWEFASRVMGVTNNGIFFPYPSEAAGWELGVSDGTVEGTVLYRDLLAGPDSSTPQVIKGRDNRLAVRTRAEIGGKELYLELLEQDRAFWYGLDFSSDELLRVDEIDGYTAIALRLSTQGDDGIILVEEATGAERRLSRKLNSPFYHLSDNRLAFWQGLTQLFVTAGPEATDETSEVFDSFTPENTAQLGDLFVLPAAGFDGSMEIYDVNTGSRSPIPDVENEPVRDFFTAGSRAYFGGISLIPDEEVHYFEKGTLRSLVGRVYQDNNLNGNEDAGDIPLAGVQIRATGQNSTFATTDDAGFFRLLLDDATTYTIALEDDFCYSATTNPSSFEVTPAAFPEDTLVIGVEKTGEAPALRAVVSSGTTRCGFTVPVWLSVVNTGCQAVSTEINFQLPEGTTIGEIEPVPASANEIELVWTDVPLAPGESWQALLELTMPGEERVGESLDFVLTATGIYDFDLTVEDVNTYVRTLRCAIDPNDKLVQPARSEESNSNYTQIDETLTYTIRFQNTGNDTAINVRLEDQLAPTLDLSTFKPLVASDPYRVELSETGLLQVYFDNIFLPDSNVNEIASHGFFTFAINLQETALNTTVENTAGIYFDFNAPVITNSVVSTVVEFLDEDEDDFFFWEECDDQNPDINPDAIDIGGNGIDEDCDGRDWTTSVRQVLPGNLALFPNPVSDELRLTYSLPDRLLITIFDGRGRRMQSEVITSSGRLNLAALPPAIYLVRVLEERSGARTTRRVVKR